MALRKAFALPMTLIVFAHNENDARENMSDIAGGLSGVINAVDAGPWNVTSGTRSRRIHLNYSTAEIHEIPRRARRRTK